MKYRYPQPNRDPWRRVHMVTSRLSSPNFPILMMPWKERLLWSAWCRAHRPWKAAHARRYR